MKKSIIILGLIFLAIVIPLALCVKFDLYLYLYFGRYGLPKIIAGLIGIILVVGFVPSSATNKKENPRTAKPPEHR
jgi:uncharacterized protein YpmB